MVISIARIAQANERMCSCVVNNKSNRDTVHALRVGSYLHRLMCIIQKTASTPLTVDIVVVACLYWVFVFYFVTLQKPIVLYYGRPMQLTQRLVSALCANTDCYLAQQ